MVELSHLAQKHVQECDHLQHNRGPAFDGRHMPWENSVRHDNVGEGVIFI